MSLHKTIMRLNHELIAAFAELDCWFDHDLDRVESKAGQWNPHQILEHVVLTNRYLLMLITKGCDRAATQNATSPFPEDYVLESPALLDIADPEAFPWERPDHMEPKGDRSLTSLRDEFRSQLYECLCNLDKIENGQGILHKIGMSVNELGKLDMYQYLYFLALHIRRHLVQLQKHYPVMAE